jgi:hypothetical protein
MMAHNMGHGLISTGNRKVCGRIKLKNCICGGGDYMKISD